MLSTSYFQHFIQHHFYMWTYNLVSCTHRKKMRQINVWFYIWCHSWFLESTNDLFVVKIKSNNDLPFDYKSSSWFSATGTSRSRFETWFFVWLQIKHLALLENHLLILSTIHMIIKKDCTSDSLLHIQNTLW